jgi:hypothetical protein
MADGIEASPPAAPVSNDPSDPLALAWERLWLVYNATLAFIVLVFGWSNLTDRHFLWVLAHGAFWANVCFCLGPVAEYYLVLLGAHRIRYRVVMFILGMMLATLFTMIAVLSWGPHGFD